MVYGSSWAHTGYWGENLIPWGDWTGTSTSPQVLGRETCPSHPADGFEAVKRKKKGIRPGKRRSWKAAAISGQGTNFVLLRQTAAADPGIFAGVERSAAQSARVLFVADSEHRQNIFP